MHLYSRVLRAEFLLVMEYMFLSEGEVFHGDFEALMGTLSKWWSTIGLMAHSKSLRDCHHVPPVMGPSGADTRSGASLLGVSWSDRAAPGLLGPFIPSWPSRASSWTGPPEPCTGSLGHGRFIRCYTQNNFTPLLPAPFFSYSSSLLLSSPPLLFPLLLSSSPSPPSSPLLSSFFSCAPVLFSPPPLLGA